MTVKGQKTFAVFIAPDSACPKSAARYGTAVRAQTATDNTAAFVTKKHF
jgi:hypothetical protein